MTSIIFSTILSISISLVLSLSTSFSTVLQTSKPIVVTTVTSITNRLSTDIKPTTLTQPDVVMASTIAVPTTITQTLSSTLTRYTPISTLPPSTSTVTATITTTYFQTGQALTYYPPIQASNSFEITQYPAVTLGTPTVTVTEILLLLENAAGQVYSSIGTALSTNTNPIILVPGDNQTNGNGWSDWSNAEKGGLISGVILAFLLIVGVLILLLRCLRQRSVWVADDGMRGMVPMVQTAPANSLVVPQAYWGPGLAGWGIRN